MIRKPPNYWTKEKCTEEALKYKSKGDFQKNASRAYKLSRKNNWLNDICKHMPIKGNRYKRCIYVYEFSDKHVYVGLTFNIEKRHIDRFNSKTDAVVIYIEETSLTPLRKQLTEYIDVEEAIKMEEFYVNYYKDNGWIILNKVKTGAIGGGKLIWTYDACKTEALKYKSKSDFKYTSNGSYHSARKNGWLDDICIHMISTQNPNGYWTKEKCTEEALKYNLKNEFKLNSGGAYNSARKNGWLIDICKHMIIQKMTKNYWTFEKCQEEVLKFNSIKEIYTNHKSLYNKIHTTNWIDKLQFNFILLKKGSF